MLRNPTRPAPRLRCRKCSGTNIALTGRTQRGIKPHHTHARGVRCADCGHQWWSRSRAAEALYPAYLEAAGQRVITWDEMPLKNPLTAPPLPD